jgi:cytochrome c oxidase subunit II
MSASTRRLLVVGIVFLAGIILVTGTLMIAGWISSGSSMMNWGFARGGRFPLRGFDTNGERIYFTGTSETGPRISSQMQGMHRMPSGRMSCADCHGPDGRGGTARMMMSTFEAPDIRYHTLTGEEHGDGHADHPPYTDEDIKRAITEGVDPAGEPLEWLMPRWEMSDQQLDDLLAFLKSLD